MKKLIITLFILLTSSVLLAECIPSHNTINGLYGGYFTSDCNYCVDDEYMDCTYNYHNFSGVKGLIANGKASAHIEMIEGFWANYITITFNGGPVNYIYNGQNFEVYYKYLYFEFTVTSYSATLTNLGGGLTINGEYYNAFEGLEDILF